MNGELLIQRFNKLPDNLQLLVFGYVDYLIESYNIVEDAAKIDEISPELKTLLDERIANYEKNPQKVKTWQEIEERLLKKYKNAV